MPRQLVIAYATLKKAAAEVNHAGGRLSARQHRLIMQACDEILDGQHQDQFPLHVWLSGSGTQFNMNVNDLLPSVRGLREALAMIAAQVMGNDLAVGIGGSGGRLEMEEFDRLVQLGASDRNQPDAEHLIAEPEPRQRERPKPEHPPAEAEQVKVDEERDRDNVGKHRPAGGEAVPERTAEANRTEQQDQQAEIPTVAQPEIGVGGKPPRGQDRSNNEDRIRDQVDRLGKEPGGASALAVDIEHRHSLGSEAICRLKIKSLTFIT